MNKGPNIITANMAIAHTFEARAVKTTSQSAMNEIAIQAASAEGIARPIPPPTHHASLVACF
jgi:hypothetical protein